MNKYAHLAPPPPHHPSLASQHKSKVKLRTFDAAQRAAQRAEQRGWGHLTPYLCGLCGGYHIGHVGHHDGKGHA